MKSIQELTKTVQIEYQASGGRPNSTGEDYSLVDKRRVKTMFMRMQSIYGEVKYRKAYPTDEDERAAMREWAPNILALSQTDLDTRIHHAKGMMHQSDWQWPNIGMILAGDGALGQSAMSRRHIDDLRDRDGRPIGLSPPPVEDADRAAGRALLASLRAGITDRDAPEELSWRQRWAKRERDMAGVESYSPGDAVRGRRFEEEDGLDDRLASFCAVDEPDSPVVP